MQGYNVHSWAGTALGTGPKLEFLCTGDIGFARRVPRIYIYIYM